MRLTTTFPAPEERSAPISSASPPQKSDFSSVETVFVLWLSEEAVEPPEEPPVVPPVPPPPPEVDVEAALASVERIRVRGAAALLTSHFGVVDDPLEGCDRAAARIREWSEQARKILEAGPEVGVDDVARSLRRLAAEDFLADSGRQIDMGRYNLIGSIEMNAAGLTRYWRKRWEAQVEAEG